MDGRRPIGLGPAAAWQLRCPPESACFCRSHGLTPPPRTCVSVDDARNRELSPLGWGCALPHAVAPGVGSYLHQPGPRFCLARASGAYENGCAIAQGSGRWRCDRRAPLERPGSSARMPSPLPTPERLPKRLRPPGLWCLHAAEGATNGQDSGMSRLPYRGTASRTVSARALPCKTNTTGRVAGNDRARPEPAPVGVWRCLCTNVSGLPA